MGASGPLRITVEKSSGGKDGLGRWLLCCVCASGVCWSCPASGRGGLLPAPKSVPLRGLCDGAKKIFDRSSLSCSPRSRTGTSASSPRSADRLHSADACGLCEDCDSFCLPLDGEGNSGSPRCDTGTPAGRGLETPPGRGLCERTDEGAPVLFAPKGPDGDGMDNNDVVAFRRGGVVSPSPLLAFSELLETERTPVGHFSPP